MYLVPINRSLASLETIFDPSRFIMVLYVILLILTLIGFVGLLIFLIAVLT